MTSSTARAHVPGSIPSWSFGDKLRKARETTGLGQVAFADEVEIAASTLGAYEKNRVLPRYPDMVSIAKRVGVRTGIPYQWFLLEDQPTWPTAPTPTTVRGTDQ